MSNRFKNISSVPARVHHFFTRRGRIFFALLLLVSSSLRVGAQTATISGTTTVCQNATQPQIIFTGSGGTAPYTFTYSINGGANQITGPGNPSVTVAAPTNAAGIFDYTLVSAVDNSGASLTLNNPTTVTVTVVSPPTADAGSNQSTCSNSGAVNITAGSSATNNSGITWTSGGTGTFANPTSL